MQVPIPALSALIGQIYEAAEEPSVWDSFLESLGRQMRAGSAALVMHHLGSELHTLSASWQIPSEAAVLYERHYGALDIWAGHGRSKPAGYVCESERLVPTSEIENTEIYNDYMVPFQFGHAVFGVVENNPDRWASVSFYRPPSAKEFGSTDIGVLELLVPHIQRAFKLHFQFAELNSRAEGLETALNLLPTGVVIVAEGSKIVLMNRHAEELFRRRDGLLISRGNICATLAAESRRLSGLLIEATRTSNGNGYSAGGPVVVSRLRGRPLSVVVSPLHTTPRIGGRGPLAVLFITDPDRAPELPAEALKRVYGFTNAEARLALALIKGDSLKHTADELQISYNTAKSQLKAVFDKSGVTRQSELVRLLLSSCPVLDI